MSKIAKYSPVSLPIWNYIPLTEILEIFPYDIISIWLQNVWLSEIGDGIIEEAVIKDFPVTGCLSFITAYPFVIPFLANPENPHPTLKGNRSLLYPKNDSRYKGSWVE